MRKFLTISGGITILHLGEDFLLIVLGRYTELNIFLIIIASVVFGFLLAGLAKHNKIKKFLLDGK